MFESKTLGCGESIVIEPTPVYVMKVKAHDRKVFINICSSESVESPASTNSEKVRLPISIGQVFRDVDRRGRGCDVIDVVVSPNTVRESVMDSTFRDRFHELVLASIREKHSIALPSEWKVIKKQYIGENVRPQFIRCNRINLITEIPDSLHHPTSSEDYYRDIIFTMIYRGAEAESSVDVLTYARDDENRETFKKGLMHEFSSNSSIQSCTKNLKEVLAHMTTCDLSLLNICNPGLYKLRLSSHRLQVFKTGMNRKEYNIWFPKMMDPTVATAQYDKESRKIILSIRSKE